jgi:hypothetical protein
LFTVDLSLWGPWSSPPVTSVTILLFPITVRQLRIQSYKLMTRGGKFTAVRSATTRELTKWDGNAQSELLQCLDPSMRTAVVPHHKTRNRMHLLAEIRETFRNSNFITLVARNIMQRRIRLEMNCL